MTAWDIIYTVGVGWNTIMNNEYMMNTTRNEINLERKRTTGAHKTRRVVISLHMMKQIATII